MAEKKEVKKKKGRARSALYKDGDCTAKACPKCGDGYWMAQHQDRNYCGKCKYTEFGTKK